MVSSQKMPSRCPACGQALVVETLRCPACRTVVEGHYGLSRFMLLTPELLHFCELFLQSRGSLKELGNKLGISYPTARNRLDELLVALGFENDRAKDKRLEILERLTRGELTHEQALRLIKEDEME